MTQEFEQPKINDTVVFAVAEGYTETVSAESFNGFFEQVDRYESEFPAWKSLPRGLINNFKADVSSESTSIVDENEMTGEMIAFSNTPLLKQVGLSLNALSSEDGEIGKIEIDINTPNRAENFLKGTSKDQARGPFNFGLSRLSGSIAERIRDRFIAEEPKEEILERYEESIALLQELGFKKEVLKADKYLKTIMGNYLEEFLMAERSQLLEKPSSWDPATWQKEITPDGLAHNWLDVFEALNSMREKMSENPELLDFYKYCVTRVKQLSNLYPPL